MFVKNKDMPIYSFKEFIPVVHPSSFVHPTATVIGNVIIGKKVYVGPNAVLRGDWGLIRIDDGCNVQENCVIHMFPGTTVHLEQNAHVGHGAIIHGANLGKNCLIGMNSVIMDDVVIGENTIVGALSMVKSNEILPPNTLAVGNPAKVVKQLSEDQIDWKTKGTEYYQRLPSDCKESLKECKPLDSIEDHRPMQASDYKTWKSS